MAYRATQVASEPIQYFRQDGDAGPRLRVGDVVLRANQDPKEIFARLIRLATNSHWSHSSLLYMLSDPLLGFDNTFLVEAMTTGVRVTSWDKEVTPPERFTVGIKRVPMDWYVESPGKVAGRDQRQRDDTHGIHYLRHVRGMALDQIDDLYDHDVVNELSALYFERIFKRHLGAVPELAKIAASFASHYRKKDDVHSTDAPVLRFICSGLVQYSFFEAVRRDIMKDMEIPEHRAAALSNLQNMHRIIFCPDPDGVIERYVKQVKSGEVAIHTAVPNDVLDLLKTATPADFNNSANLAWRYIIRKGIVWQIDEAEEGYKPQSDDEQSVLALLHAEHRS